jgi:glycosyltransferase involved in cell wall biosynthesis
MRIAYLSNARIPSRVANSVHVMKICQAFARQGHDVTLFGRPGREAAEDVFGYYGVAPCFSLVLGTYPRRLPVGAGWVCALSIARSVRRLPGVDLIYSRSVKCLIACGRGGPPFVFEDHESPARTRLQRYLTSRILRRPGFRLLVVITRALRDEYLRVFPWLAPDKVLVAPDGADVLGTVSTWPPARHWPGRAAHLQVGYVGHLYPGKGMEVVLPLAKALPDVDFHIVGGSEHDIAYWQQRAGQRANVHFHGHVPPAECDSYRCRMDVLLAPLQRQVYYVMARRTASDIAPWTSPLKLFEYMAAGKPMIASDLPVLREVLEHNVNALLVPPDDVDAWAKTVRFLADHPDESMRLGQRARHDLETRFTWDKRAEAILSAFGLSEPTERAGDTAETPARKGARCT